MQAEKKHFLLDVWSTKQNFSLNFYTESHFDKIPFAYDFLTLYDRQKQLQCKASIREAARQIQEVRRSTNSSKDDPKHREPERDLGKRHSNTKQKVRWLNTERHFTPNKNKTLKYTKLRLIRKHKGSTSDRTRVETRHESEQEVE